MPFRVSTESCASHLILDCTYRSHCLRCLPPPQSEISFLAISVLDRRYVVNFFSQNHVSPDGYPGAGTICFAIFAWFWLPLSPSTWTRLNERQKTVARSRILADSSVVVDERLNIRDAFQPFADPMYWYKHYSVSLSKNNKFTDLSRLWAVISLSFGVPLASVNNFLPQIVASLGYSTVRTNLLTVAPNIVGTVALLLLTFSSDYFRERSFHMCVGVIFKSEQNLIFGPFECQMYSFSHGTDRFYHSGIH